AVGRPKLAAGGPGLAVAVLDPGGRLLRRPGAGVDRDRRLGVDQPAELHELVGADQVRLGLGPEVVEAEGAALARADAVAPVVVLGEVAARPAQQAGSELPGQLQDVVPPADGRARLGAGPEAAVYPRAEVLEAYP